MNQSISDDEPYASYKNICTKLLEDYGNCILEKSKTNPFACNDKLYLIQKWCMNPVGVIHHNTLPPTKNIS
jgi:hypothetical protein